MKYYYRTILSWCLVMGTLCVMGCGDDKKGDNLGTNPLEGGYTYYVGFLSAYEGDPVSHYVYITGKDENTIIPEVSVTFNGENLYISHHATGAIGGVTADEGGTYTGTVSIGGRAFDFSVTMVHKISSVTMEANTSTPEITWTLDGSNQSQAIAASWNDGNGDSDMYKPLSADTRSYTFSWHAYTDRELHELNYRSYGNDLLVYSLDYFDFDRGRVLLSDEPNKIYKLLRKL